MLPLRSATRSAPGRREARRLRDPVPCGGGARVGIARSERLAGGDAPPARLGLSAHRVPRSRWRLRSGSVFPGDPERARPGAAGMLVRTGAGALPSSVSPRKFPGVHAPEEGKPGRPPPSWNVPGCVLVQPRQTEPPPTRELVRLERKLLEPLLSQSRDVAGSGEARAPALSPNLPPAAAALEGQPIRMNS